MQIGHLPLQSSQLVLTLHLRAIKCVLTESNFLPKLDEESLDPPVLYRNHRFFNAVGPFYVLTICPNRRSAASSLTLFLPARLRPTLDPYWPLGQIGRPIPPTWPWPLPSVAPLLACRQPYSRPNYFGVKAPAAPAPTS